MKNKGYVKGDYYRWGVRPDNTIENLYKIWSGHDWNKNPNEWIPSRAWKASFKENILNSFLRVDSSILEIGCGNGRWSEDLLEKANQLILIDIVPYCIEQCKIKFKDYDFVECHVTNGKDLSFLEDTTIDFVFSIDVFIQVNSIDTLNYMEEIARVLKPGGKGLIHHSKKGQTMSGWRSDMTQEKMRSMCELNKLLVLDQFSEWENGKFQIWPGRDSDAITIFQKPL